jgi:hypothetical protein
VLPLFPDCIVKQLVLLDEIKQREALTHWIILSYHPHGHLARGPHCEVVVARLFFMLYG